MDSQGDGESQESSAEGDRESQRPVMDIMKAAEVGDVSLLRKAYEDNVGDLESYFLGRTVKEMMSYPNVEKWKYHGHTHYNILHKAVESGQYNFLCEALEFLKSHPTLIIHLICQTGYYGNNCLHDAVYKANIYVVKLLVHAYVTAVASADNSEKTLMPPWLWVDHGGSIPVRHCFIDALSNEEVKAGMAMYLVLQDQHLGRDRYPPKCECSTLILDSKNRSVVFKAMESGWSLLVEHILISDLPYNLDGSDDTRKRVTPLHYASRCNAKVSILLLEKHPELINVPSDKSVLHAAVEDGATWLVKLMLVGDETPVPTWIKACRRLMWHKNDRGETPLHLSARLGSTKIAELIIQAYYSTIQDEATTWDADVEARPDIPYIGVNLLLMKNSDGEVPLYVALRNKRDDCGVMLSKQTIPLLSFENRHWDALLDAVNTGCRQSIKTIIALLFAPAAISLLQVQFQFQVQLQFSTGIILTPAVANFFKYLAQKYRGFDKLLKSEELEKLSKVLPELVKEPVKDGKTILTEAAERGEDWLVTLCLESHKDLLMESARAWQAACENGYVSTLLTFISKFGDQEFIRHCANIQQTPLHLIKLKQYGEYMELLRNPVLEVIKNQKDGDGATPLHRAIQSDNLELVKALLQSNGIEVNIKDNNGMIAFILLENRRKHSDTWHEQYIELLKNPRFKELINQTDSDEATPLHRAIQRDDLELTKTLLEIKGINVTIKNKNGMTASDLLEDRCKSARNWHGLYIKLLKSPGFKELINQTDSDEATPLHRAIQRDDLELTKTLLEIKGINVSIKNKNGMTASDLLEDRCKSARKWGKMCRQIEQDETVENLKFVFRSIAFEGMQNTLSLVAALVATITFAAGITVPGGVDSSNGEAVLSTKAAFLVFSVSNTTAMCSSIMVLFLLLGPMMWDPQPSLFYVKLSLYLLLLSLGGTMLAFMTGVYATMINKVKWNAIFILVSCSLTLFVSCIILLSTYSRRFKNLHKLFTWLTCQGQTQNTEVGQFSRTSTEAPVDVKIEIQST